MGISATVSEAVFTPVRPNWSVASTVIVSVPASGGVKVSLVGAAIASG